MVFKVSCDSDFMGKIVTVSSPKQPLTCNGYYKNQTSFPLL